MPVATGTALLAGGLLSAGAGMYGAKKTADTQKDNLAAQQQQFNQLSQMVQGQMNNGPNPYSQQMMQFLGLGQPAQMNRNGILGQIQGRPGSIGQQDQPGMYRYDQGTDPFLAEANTIDLNALQQMTAPQIKASGLIDFSKLGIGPVQQAQAGLIDPSVTQSQAFNTGQDSLMQMLNQDFTPQMDQGLSAQLGQYAGGNSQFDTSGLLDALRPNDNRMLEEQVSNLRGSAGSLGERLGTGMMQQEGQLRGNFMDQVSARNAGIQQQSFEAAQARALQALGMQTGREQAFAGLGLQGQQLQSGNAQSLAQLGLGQSGLQADVAKTNAANQTSTSQANAENWLRAQIANQQTNLSGQQTNADILNRIALANQSAQMQAGLANQSFYNQGMFNNSNILNQNSQFNAGQRTNQNQFAASQGNIYNQMMMSGLGQANQMGFQDRSLNAQLLGILGGQQVPQAQASPWPQAISDMGSTAMMLPFLMQMSQQQRSPAATYNPAMAGAQYPGAVRPQNGNVAYY